MPEHCLRCVYTKKAFIVYLKLKFRGSPVACLAALGPYACWNLGEFP